MHINTFYLMYSNIGNIIELIHLPGDIRMLNFIVPHIGLTSFNKGELVYEVGYHYQKFGNEEYTGMVQTGESLYRNKPDDQGEALRKQIKYADHRSELSAKPLVTAKCRYMVDYKEWLVLAGKWVQELCVLDVGHVVQTG